MSFRTPAPGLLVDQKYRLAERIGGGGMGDVYRAENVLAGRAVAIKFLRPELVDNAELAQRFFQEAQAVNRIRHPNIVDVLDAGIGEAGPYLVMEYLEGESAASVLARIGRFDVDAAVGTVMPVLEALDAAHRVGIVHRDLKPENVFFATDPVRGGVVVRLLDFGIAKVLETTPNEPSPRTRTGVVYGTPDYLSPEQATGDAPLDGRSDLFAVGVLFYELLTGTRPFRAPTAVATAFRVVHAEPAPLASAGVHVDPRIEAVAQRLLRKESAKRFPTAGDVVRELDRIVPDAQRRVAAVAHIAHRRGGAPVGERIELSRGDAHASDALEPFARVTGMSVATGRLTTPGSASVPLSGRFARTPDPTNVRVEEARGPHFEASRQLVSIRPFPNRFAGRYHVRGPVLRSVDRALVETYGAAARDAVVSHMPPHHEQEFRNDSINALVAYELEALDAYLELATMLVVRDVDRWRDLGRNAVDGELEGVVRTVVQPSSNVAVVLRRGVSVWSRLFDFGSWRVTTGAGGRALLHVTEFDPASLPLRLWVVGVVEATARRATGSDLKVQITFGEIGFSPELACEIG